MDDDDVRRGRPTLHRVFGEAVATAAGVAMVPLAARSAVLACESLGLAPSTTSEIVRELMRASGATGMVGGQWLDLATEGCALSVEELEAIHQAKTGALIAAAVVIGGMAAGADMNRIAALRAYGRSVGLAFQIADDVLDATSTTATLGKTAGRDAERNKHTYPALLGVEGATERARALVDVACDSLRRAEVRSTTLERLAHFSVTRRK
jgi:farnesyl diphosphate synthase/geranylgeranyl diphosphate synthase type II